MKPSDPSPDELIRKLLAERREIRPPDGYVDDFLERFHRRQQSEMLRTPAWKLAFERVGAAFAEFQVPRTAYAGAFAAFVVAAVIAIGLPERRSGGGAALAQADAPPAPAVAMTLAPPAAEMVLSAVMPQAAPVVRVSGGAPVPPRYVLDARPVSHDPPFSF